MTSLPGTVKIWGGGGVEIATLLRLPPFLSPPEDGRTEEQGREREKQRGRDGMGILGSAEGVSDGRKCAAELLNRAGWPGTGTDRTVQTRNRTRPPLTRPITTLIGLRDGCEPGQQYRSVKQYRPRPLTY